MVRLVFRPFTQVWRTICTSVPLRAFTRVSPGFTLLKRSSPSFGSYQICSCSIPLSETPDRLLLLTTYPQFPYAFGFFHPNTRILDRLLGPCFKTGRKQPLWQNRPQDPSSLSPVWLINSLPRGNGRLTSLLPISNFILSLAYENHPATKR